MLDIKFIRENLEKVKRDTANKGYNTNVDAVLALDDKRKTLNQQIDELRTRRNQIASSMKTSGG